MARAFAPTVRDARPPHPQQSAETPLLGALIAELNAKSEKQNAQQRGIESVGP